MRLKIVLSLLLVLVLAGALFATNFGQNYIDFLRRSVGSFVIPFNFLNPGGEQFPFSLSSNKIPYYGASFAAANATFVSESICVTNVKVNDVYVNKADSKCSISLYSARGNFETTRAGSLVISADTEYATIDDSSFSGKLHVDVEVVPLNYVIVGIGQDRISLPAVDGKLEKFKPDGSDDITKNLKNETITIYNFAGILQLKDSEMNLQGVASGIEGSDFKIPK